MQFDKVIAIDGPAGVGKSTVAKNLARELGWKFLNTGAIYRAATIYCLGQEVPLNDGISVYCAIMQLMNETHDGYGLEISLDPDSQFVKINELDITEQIHSPEISGKVNNVSGNLQARELLIEFQQQIVLENVNQGIVLEGRDTTDVIAPSAKYRYLLTARPEIRADRRAKDINMPVDEAEKLMAKRDLIDSETTNFLASSDSNIKTIDTSDISIKDVLDMIFADIAKMK